MIRENFIMQFQTINSSIKALLFSFIFSFTLLTSLTSQANETNIPLTLRFHVVTKLDIPKDSHKLKSWITEDDIKNKVLPEVNRIWKTANISFNLDSVLFTPSLHPSNKKQITGYIANAKRDEDGKADPERIELLSNLINFENENPNAINIYFVPYLGEASQGHAKRKIKRAFIGQWTDKPSKGKNAPERFKLVENGVFKEGSIGRTVAHEIGHILGLKHPEKTTQTQINLLMGGKKAGYSLTKKDVEKARQRAKKISK
jgi:hypothetical protein